MRWRRVLSKDIQPHAGHSNHAGLGHGFQGLNVVVSGHSEAIGKKVNGYDVSMTSKGTTLVTNSGLLMA